MRNTLFIIPPLPRDIVSVAGVSQGQESLSGTLSSCLLVIEGLSRRGHPVGVVSPAGGRLVETSARVFGSLSAAAEWVGDGEVIWCSCGDYESLPAIEAAGLKPVVWLHTHLDTEGILLLRTRRVRGILVVSDLARLPFLHLSCRRSIGRVYNPLNPFFASRPIIEAGRYHSRGAVFAGHMGVTKGTHRVLGAWPHVRDRLADATLTIAGSAKLYRANHSLGPMGLASPDFEARYLRPLIDKYGSLEASGIRLAGLMTPGELRDLYNRSAVGLVNPNWDGSTETFCCTAVEMLATQLPLVSVSRGGLPETIGDSGGAILVNRPDLGALAEAIVRLLDDPEECRRLGEAGIESTRSRFDLQQIIDQWVRILNRSNDDLSNLSGPWQYRGRRVRYLAESFCGSMRIGSLYDFGMNVGRRLTRRP